MAAPSPPRHLDDVSPPPSGLARLPIEADSFVFSEGNYALQKEDGTEFSLSHKMIHYVSGQVLEEHWSACKAVFEFHAGTSTSNLFR